MEPGRIHPIGRDDSGQSAELQASCHELLHVSPKLQWHMQSTSDNNDKLLVTVEIPTADIRESPERENPALDIRGYR